VNVKVYNSFQSIYFYSVSMRFREKVAKSMVAAWLSGNALVLINVEVALRRARLVLGWVTVAGIPSW